MPLLHLVLAIIVVAIWGFNFVAIKIAMEEIPPLFLNFLRFFLSSIPLVFFLKRPKTPFKFVVLYGLLLFGLSFCLLFLGMYVGVTAGLASLLLQFQVFFTILMAIMFFHERPHLWQVLGALVSAAGIALVGFNIKGDLTFWGFWLVIAASAAWGSGNIIGKMIGKVNMVSFVAWASLVAWPPILALSLAVEGPDKIIYSMQHVSWSSVNSLLFITYVTTLIGFGIWSWLIHHHPLALIAPFTLLVPVFGMASSIYFLGEPLQSWKIYASILVIAGLCLNIMGPRLFAKKK